MTLTTFRADLLLLAAAVIWGSGFVAQRLGSEHLGALAFTGLRFTLGTLLLLPLLAVAKWPLHVSREVSRRETLRGGVLAGVVMLLAANTQQLGLGDTTASNGAFITSLYVVFVPFLGLFARQRIGWPVWTGVALAGVGLVLLGVTDDYRMKVGDLWVLLCAVLWAFHVVVVGRFSRDAEPIRLSLIQLGITGFGSLALALARGDVVADGVVAAKWAVLYGAVLPVAVAFTLQVIAQRKAPPTHTALILSLESVFGMVAGIAFLAERPTTTQYVGAALMLAGVVVSQAVKPEAIAEAEQAVHDDPQPR
ncbi:MAG: DMT family transporter [Planctomycetaceae bacterium]|jgi:drug/metabolite transporter (DMT)-like permease|nr:DMT family transporter [Planctomycetaceae bacterium]